MRSNFNAAAGHLAYYALVPISEVFGRSLEHLRKETSLLGLVLRRALALHTPLWNVEFVSREAACPMESSGSTARTASRF